MYGPEFLLYIPSVEDFATFFCGSKSARREAPNIKKLMTKPATFKSKKISNKRYTWFGPCVTTCSTPFAPPSLEELQEKVNKFNNPPDTSAEVVAEEKSEGEEERAV
jgi:hypothetical protein